MLGSIRWNLALGLAGMLLTFIFSLGNNGFAVSCLRALYAFIAFFLVCYLFRGALQLIVSSAGIGNEQPSGAEQSEVGTVVDLQTPDEGESLNDMLKAQLDPGQAGGPAAAEFKPLEPQRVFTVEDGNPEELAQAVRHLAHSGEE